MHFLFCVFLFFSTSVVFASGLSDLAKKEEGVAFEVECKLKGLDLPGRLSAVVVTARFPDSVVWATDTLLLVSMNDKKDIVKTHELKIKPSKKWNALVFPKEVIGVTCKSERIEILEAKKKGKPNKKVFKWDGKNLTNTEG